MFPARLGSRRDHVLICMDGLGCVPFPFPLHSPLVSHRQLIIMGGGGERYNYRMACDFRVVESVYGEV